MIMIKPIASFVKTTIYNMPTEDSNLLAIR